MDALRRDINEYLYHEFGKDGEESDVTDTWPFTLTLVADEHELVVFEFHDDEPYFAVASDALDFMPQAGMTIEDLRLQHIGSMWIGSRNPVDLDTTRLGDDSVPRTLERRAAIRALGAAIVPEDRLEILEGLYLQTEARYIGLFRERDAERAFTAGLTNTPIYVAFPEASSWRRVAWAVGSWLQIQSRR